jgi:hypothetical protein
VGKLGTVPGVECVGRPVATPDVCGEVGKPVDVGHHAVLARKLSLDLNWWGGRPGFRIFVAVFI